MAWLRLRTFLSYLAARGLPRWLVDHVEVRDPLSEERLIRIPAQLTAALALREQLAEVDVQDLPPNIDLRRYLRDAHGLGLIGRREHGSLMQINADANEAKHELAFVSKL